MLTVIIILSIVLLNELLVVCSLTKIVIKNKYEGKELDKRVKNGLRLNIILIALIPPYLWLWIIASRDSKKSLNKED